MANGNKPFSIAAFAEYSRARNKAFQEAFKADTLKNLAKMGYPNKDEAPEAVRTTDLCTDNTVSAVPQLIAGFMADEGRKFDIPSAGKNIAPATIRLEEIPKKVTEGINQLGANKGKPYKSVTKAHTEVKVKSHNKDFKE